MTDGLHDIPNLAREAVAHHAYVLGEASESLLEFIDGSNTKTGSQASDGSGRDGLEAYLRVTGLTDGPGGDQTVQRASDQGFACLVPVDDRPPRAGTVSSANLEPYAVAALDQSTLAHREFLSIWVPGLHQRTGEPGPTG